MEKILINSDDIVPLDLVFETFYPKLNIDNLIKDNFKGKEHTEKFKVLKYIENNFLDIMKNLKLNSYYYSFLDKEKIINENFPTSSDRMPEIIVSDFKSFSDLKNSIVKKGLVTTRYVNEIVFKVNNFTHIIKYKVDDNIFIEPYIFLGVEKDDLYLLLSEVCLLQAESRFLKSAINNFISLGIIKIYINSNVNRFNKISYYKNIKEILKKGNVDFTELTKNEVYSIFLSNKNLSFNSFSDFSNMQKFSFDCLFKSLEVDNVFDLV